MRRRSLTANASSAADSVCAGGLRRKPRTEVQALRNIRRLYREMGIPVDHLSDEELRDAIVAHSKRMLKAWEASKVTTKQAADALYQLAGAFSQGSTTDPLR